MLLRSKFSSDVTKKLKCSRWEEFVGQLPDRGSRPDKNGTSSIELPSLAILES
jgi:hypothetical protein